MSTIKLDLGPGDVHVPGTTTHFERTSTPTTIPMALDAAQRNKLKPSQFADPAERKFPIHDKAHADNAAARLEQEKGSMSPGKYARIKARVKAAQRRFGEAKPKAQRFRGRGSRMSITHPDGTRVEIHHRMSDAVDGVMLLPSLPLPTE